MENNGKYGNVIMDCRKLELTLLHASPTFNGNFLIVTVECFS